MTHYELLICNYNNIFIYHNMMIFIYDSTFQI